MSQILNPEKIMRISVLGYNFADWVKQFKKAFKQSDGTYDYMAYFSQLNNPGGFYLLIGSIGLDETNQFLNSLLTPTIDKIEIVGGMSQKGGGTMMFTILFLIFIMFMSAIESSLAGEYFEQLKQFRKQYPHVDSIVELKEPEVVVGYLWNTYPTKAQKAAYNTEVTLQRQLRDLITAAQGEAGSKMAFENKLIDQGITLKVSKLEGEVKAADVKVKTLETDKANLIAALEEAKNTIGVLVNKTDVILKELNVAANELNQKTKEVYAALLEVEQWKRYALMAGVGVGTAMFVANLYQRNKKIYFVGPQFTSFRGTNALVKMYQEQGKIVSVMNPTTGTNQLLTDIDTFNALNAALGAAVTLLGESPNAIGNNYSGPGRNAIGNNYSGPGRLEIGYNNQVARRSGGRKTRKLRKSKKINNKAR
jgi:hypothetical protein